MLFSVSRTASSSIPEPSSRGPSASWEEQGAEAINGLCLGCKSSSETSNLTCVSFWSVFFWCSPRRTAGGAVSLKEGKRVQGIRRTCHTELGVSNRVGLSPLVAVKVAKVLVNGGLNIKEMLLHRCPDGSFDDPEDTQHVVNETQRAFYNPRVMGVRCICCFTHVGE